MRLELWMLLITGAIVFHIYTDGKYTKNLMVHQKYFKMGGVIISGFILYVLLKKTRRMLRILLERQMII